MQIARANEFPANSDAIIRIYDRPISVVAKDGIMQPDPQKNSATMLRRWSHESTSVTRRRLHAE